MSAKLSEIYVKLPLKTAMGYFKNTTNTIEGTDGQKMKKIKWIAMWVLKNYPTTQFQSFFHLLATFNCNTRETYLLVTKPFRSIDVISLLILRFLASI